jgi:hypothetical protein
VVEVRENAQVCIGPWSEFAPGTYQVSFEVQNYRDGSVVFSNESVVPMWPVRIPEVEIQSSKPSYLPEYFGGLLAGISFTLLFYFILRGVKK